MATPTTGTAEQGPGLQDAAEAFSGLLDREDGTQPENPAAPPPEEDPPQGEVVADADADEAETAEGDKPEDAEDAEAADTQDDAEADAPKAVPLYPVKVNGKEERITLEEALRGYSRTRDYTQKTDALATDRNILATERAEVLKERQQYAALLPALHQQLQQAAQQEPDWDALYQQDPHLWAKTRDEWRDRQDKLAAASFEMQRLAAQNEQEQQRALQKQLSDSRQELLEKMPIWKDAKRWEADRVKIVEYGRTAGYSAEEIAQAYDPRAVVILNKARLYDDLMAQKPQAAPQRQGPRVASAGSAPVASNQGQRARQRLASTGRIEDAAKVFEGLLE